MDDQEREYFNKLIDETQKCRFQLETLNTRIADFLERFDPLLRDIESGKKMRDQAVEHMGRGFKP